MGSSITTPPPALTTRACRRARSVLGLAGFAGLVAACSAAPAENTARSSAAITGNLLSRSSPDGQITNGNGGCLDLPNGDTTNGNPLHIWACDSSGWNQTWFVDAKGSIHYAADPTKCVDFPAQDLVNGVPTDGTQLQLWDCNGASGPDQVWQFLPTNTIEFASATGKCIELQNGGYPFVNGSAQSGTPVQVFDCNGTSGQTWALLNGGVQGFQLQDGNGACLQPASATAGAALELDGCNGSVALQQWGMDGTGARLFNYATDQYVTFPAQDMTATTFVAPTQLVMANADFAQNQSITLNPSNDTMLIGGLACVEARDGSSAPNTAVQGFTCNGTTGQTWFPKPMGGTCPGTVNANGTCAPCGALGEESCWGNKCDTGTVSVNQVCECGIAGTPPCTVGGLCNTGFLLQNGTCVVSCASGLVPFNGTCATPGIVGGPCIPGSSQGTCLKEASCNTSSNTCYAAGQFGISCYVPSMTCDANLYCDTYVSNGLEYGNCEPTGSAGVPCNADGTCNAGALVCLAGTPNTCGACGTKGNWCCLGQDGSSADGSSNDACGAGLTCQNYHCQTPPAGGGSSGGGGSGLCGNGSNGQSFTVCCGDESLTYDACSLGDAIAEGEDVTGLGCEEGACP
jgi:Ricin-type beta-trefoil lectin domain